MHTKMFNQMFKNLVMFKNTRTHSHMHKRNSIIYAMLENSNKLIFWFRFMVFLG